MIYLATDHRGYELKEKIKQWLSDWGYEYEDMGAFAYDPHDDFPDFVKLAALKVSQDSGDSKAIVLGASGQGEAMTANRFKGVRAAVYYGGSLDIVSLSREHNNANVLSLGVAPGSTIEKGKPLAEETVREAVKLWLETPFSGDERHVRRLAKIDEN